MSETVTYEEARALVQEAGWDVGEECPTCGGDGTVPGGRKVVHTYRGGFGADNDVDAVLNDLASSTGSIQYGRSEAIGPYLRFHVDGKAMSVQVGER